MSFYLTDSHVIIHSDHKPLQKFIYAITANDRVNDWSFQIHAICHSIHFEYIKGAANVLSDSLSRLSYYELYEEPKLEKEGYEFNKPIVEVDESMYKPIQTAYGNGSQDPGGNVDADMKDIHVALQKKIPKEQIIKLQQEEFAGVIKNVKKHQEKLSHLYIIDKEGILK